MSSTTTTAPPSPTAPPEASDPLVLELLAGETGPERFTLPEGPTSIGSGRRCTIRLSAPGVGPLHCVISRGPGGAVVRRWSADTTLNGETFQESALREGDRLTIASVDLVVAAPPEIHPPRRADPPRSDEDTDFPEAAVDAYPAVDPGRGEANADAKASEGANNAANDGAAKDAVANDGAVADGTDDDQAASYATARDEADAESTPPAPSADDARQTPDLGAASRSAAASFQATAGAPQPLPAVPAHLLNPVAPRQETDKEKAPAAESDTDQLGSAVLTEGAAVVAAEQAAPQKAAEPKGFDGRYAKQRLRRLAAALRSERRQVADARGELADAVREAASLAAEVQGARGELADACQTSLGFQRDLSTAVDQIADAGRDFQVAVAERGEKQQRVEQLESEVRRLEGAVQRLEGELAERSAAVAVYDQRVAELEAAVAQLESPAVAEAIEPVIGAAEPEPEPTPEPVAEGFAPPPSWPMEPTSETDDAAERLDDATAPEPASEDLWSSVAVEAPTYESTAPTAPGGAEPSSADAAAEPAAGLWDEPAAPADTPVAPEARPLAEDTPAIPAAAAGDLWDIESTPAAEPPRAELPSEPAVDASSTAVPNSAEAWLASFANESTSNESTSNESTSNESTANEPLGDGLPADGPPADGPPADGPPADEPPADEPTPDGLNKAPGLSDAIANAPASTPSDSADEVGPGVADESRLASVPDVLPAEPLSTPVAEGVAQLAAEDAAADSEATNARADEPAYDQAVAEEPAAGPLAEPAEPVARDPADDQPVDADFLENLTLGHGAVDQPGFPETPPPAAPPAADVAGSELDSPPLGATLLRDAAGDPPQTVDDLIPTNQPQSGAPTSFIEQYANSLPADDLDPVEASPFAAPSVEAPALPLGVGASASGLEGADDAGEDGSIEDYMAGLMERIRGEADGPSVAAPPTPAAPAPSPTPQAAAAPVPEPLGPGADGLPEPPLSPITNLEDLRSGPAPERARDMSALRELANSSARSAIGAAAKKQNSEKAFANLAISGIAMGCGGFLAATAPELLSGQFLGGVAGFGWAGYWGWKTLQHILAAKKAEGQIGARSSAPAGGESLPIA